MGAETAFEKSFSLNSTKDFASKIDGSTGMIFEVALASNQKVNPNPRRTQQANDVLSSTMTSFGTVGSPKKSNKNQEIVSDYGEGVPRKKSMKKMSKEELEYLYRPIAI